MALSPFTNFTFSTVVIVPLQKWPGLISKPPTIYAVSKEWEETRPDYFPVGTTSPHIPSSVLQGCSQRCLGGMIWHKLSQEFGKRFIPCATSTPLSKKMAILWQWKQSAMCQEHMTTLKLTYYLGAGASGITETEILPLVIFFFNIGNSRSSLEQFHTFGPWPAFTRRPIYGVMHIGCVRTSLQIVTNETALTLGRMEGKMSAKRVLNEILCYKIQCDYRKAQRSLRTRGVQGEFRDHSGPGGSHSKQLTGRKGSSVLFCLRYMRLTSLYLTPCTGPGKAQGN